jgi:putative transposase
MCSIPANRPRRKCIRLPGYDYSVPGAYYVTVCTLRRRQLFGVLSQGEVLLSRLGAIARECWLRIPACRPDVRLDEFKVMPDHVHGILVIEESIAQMDERVAREEREARERATLASPPQPGGACGPDCGAVGAIVGGYKSAVTREIHKIRPGMGVWQRGFFDHIVRGEDDLERIRHYIRSNAREP